MRNKKDVLNEPPLVVRDARASSGAVRGIAIARNNIDQRGPISAAIGQIDGILVDKEGVAAGVVHRDSVGGLKGNYRVRS